MERGEKAFAGKQACPIASSSVPRPLIVARQVRQALEDGIPGAPVVVAGYGNDTKIRQAILDLGRDYVVGIQLTFSLWEPGLQPRPPTPCKSNGRPPKRLHHSLEDQPVLARELASQIPEADWKNLTWRVGTKQSCELVSRRCGFARQT